MVYKWKAASHFSEKQAPAQAIGERIESIREANGGVFTPEDVVADAKSKKSPLHPLFEWDDKTAAHEFRITQAREVIRAVVVVMEERKESAPREYISISHAETGKPVYTSMKVAMANPESRAEVLERAFSELQAWRKRYAELQELAGIFEAMDLTLATAA